MLSYHLHQNTWQQPFYRNVSDTLYRNTSTKIIRSQPFRTWRCFSSSPSMAQCMIWNNYWQSQFKLCQNSVLRHWSIIESIMSCLVTSRQTSPRKEWRKLESAMGNAKAAFYKFCSMKSTCEKCCEPGPKKMCLRDVSSWRAVENLSTVCPRCEAVQSLARPFKEVESKVKELSIVNYSGDTHNRYW